MKMQQTRNLVMINKKKQRLKEGDFFKIELYNDEYSYGRVLKEPLMAFYEGTDDGDKPINEIEESNILFKIWVANDAIKSGRWIVIGNKPLSSDLEKKEYFLKQDQISKKIYLVNGFEEKPISKNECNGYERAAVWSAIHVEDRLRDYYKGIPNKWVESLKIIN